MEAKGKLSAASAAKVVALFVLMGGPIGGVVTMAVVCAWSVFVASSEVQLEWIPQILLLLPVGALIGVVLGIPAAFATGLLYALQPRARRAVPITAVGAIASAIEGALVSVAITSPPAELFGPAVSWAGVFALSGALAALACHSHLVRWG